MPDPTAFAVPFFLLFIVGEHVIAKRRGVTLYRFTDTLTNLSCGLVAELGVLMWAAAQLACYAWVYEHARVANLVAGPPWVLWVVTFFAVDFAYYWWHRLSHVVNILWAAHVVHHQSEELNFAVGLRQGIFTNWTILPFYLPLAAVGIPPIVYISVVSASALYQFWIHTRLIGRVRGPIAFALNLPGHHRVHHAVNARFLDKNFGATLIVWDRLFGTFADEDPDNACIYGITTPLKSCNPLRAQLHYWAELARASLHARGARKLGVWLARPSSMHAPTTTDIAGPSSHAHEKFDPPISRALARYVSINYVVLILGTVALLVFGHAVSRVAFILSGCAIFGAAISIGALLEGRSWARGAEALRIGLFMAALACATVLR